jgi:hypothetical protein
MYDLLIHCLVILSDQGTALDSVRHSISRSLSQKQGLKRPQKMAPSRGSRFCRTFWKANFRCHAAFSIPIGAKTHARVFLHVTIPHKFWLVLTKSMANSGILDNSMRMISSVFWGQSKDKNRMMSMSRASQASPFENLDSQSKFITPTLS